MLQIFVTAFEPYGGWAENASWLALKEFTKDLPTSAKITTRRYPVDFQAVQARLAADLQSNFDYAVLLGQAPGSTHIRLEALGVNVGGHHNVSDEILPPLISDGPAAYQTDLPLGHWVSLLRSAAIPASISYHAGTYLCNAALYFAHHFARIGRLRTKPVFLHLPLDPSQACKSTSELASLPASTSAAALRLIVDDLVKRGPPAAPELV